MAKKTKRTPALITKLLGYIEDGLCNSQACAACGIGVTTLREWRAADPTFEERLGAAREVLRSKVLVKIREAGASDWRALAEFLRLSFAEYRFGNGPSVNVAIQQNMAVSDPERARLIAQLEERRASALADKSGASEPLQLTDANDRREEALAYERALKEGVIEVREQPPKTVVERADLIEERRQWRDAARRDEVEELLGD